METNVFDITKNKKNKNTKQTKHNTQNVLHTNILSIQHKYFIWYSYTFFIYSYPYINRSGFLYTVEAVILNYN